MRKMTSRCQKQLPMKNTPGSLDTLGEYTRESRLSVVNARGSLDSPVVNTGTPGSLDFLVYLLPASEIVYKNKT